MTGVHDLDPAVRDEVLADPVGRIVALVTRADAGLDPSIVRDVVTRVAPGRAKVRRLAVAVAERPAVLCDGRSPAPLVVGELLVALRAAGAESISAPLCARCDRLLRGSMARRGQDWCCHPCGRDRERCTGCGHDRAVSRRDRHGRPYCPHCPPADAEDPQALLVGLLTGVDPSLGAVTVAAAVERAAPAPAARQRLASTIRTQPDLLTGQGHQAPHPAVLRLIDELVAAGAQAIVRPACPGCGRVTALTRCRDGQRICRRCNTAARAQPCAGCGRDREPAARDQHGQPLCSRCLLNDPVNQQPCSRCGRRRPVEAQTADGAVCPSCRPARVLTCTICGRTGPAEISRVTGQPWCTACQQRWARCTRCGVTKLVRSGTLEAPLCAGCTDTEQPWQACPSCGGRGATGRRSVPALHSRRPCPPSAGLDPVAGLVADQPPVQVGLLTAREGEPLAREPLQQDRGPAHSLADAGGLTVGGRAVAVAGAQPPQQVPDRVVLEQVPPFGVRDSIEGDGDPALQAHQLLVAFGQRPGGDQHATQVLHGLVVGELVERAVGQRTRPTAEVAQHVRGGTAVQPVEHGGGSFGTGQGLLQRLQPRRDDALVVGEHAHDREAYTEAKAEFVRRVLDQRS